MNVYDFDGTIYAGDSTRDFIFYVLKRDKQIVKYIPQWIIYYLKYLLGIVSKTRMKEAIYQFLNGFAPGEIENIVYDFWKTHNKNIYDWYLVKKKLDDVIISASPRFLLSPMCSELNVNLICSEVDAKTGKYDGYNCYGEEKVKRFKSVYGDILIDEFYSDSNSDLPLAKISKKAYKVKRNGKVINWKIS